MYRPLFTRAGCRREVPFLLSALTGLGLAACDGAGSPSVEGPVTGDSAGIQVVEYPAGPPEAPEWSVSLRDAVHLSGDFFRIRGAVRSEDGRVAVADGAELRVRFFAADGSPAGEAGREGEGPGEFRHLSALMPWPGDSLLVWDQQLRRLTVFDAVGEVGRTFDLEVTEAVPFAQPRGVHADGRILATGFSQTPPGGPEGGRQRYPSPAYLFGPEGELEAELGLEVSGETYFELVERGFTVLPVLFGRSTRLLAASDVLLEAANDRFELRVLTPAGEPVRIIRMDVGSPRISDTMRRELIEGRLEEGVGGTRDPDEVRAALEAMPVPERLPAFDRLVVDRLDRIWVELYPTVGAVSSSWLVLTLEGETVGQVELPRNFDPLEIGSDYVVGVLTDEMDVEHVVVAELERRSG